MSKAELEFHSKACAGWISHSASRPRGGSEWGLASLCPLPGPILCGSHSSPTALTPWPPCAMAIHLCHVIWAQGFSALAIWPVRPQTPGTSRTALLKGPLSALRATSWPWFTAFPWSGGPHSLLLCCPGQGQKSKKSPSTPPAASSLTAPPPQEPQALRWHLDFSHGHMG